MKWALGLVMLGALMLPGFGKCQTVLIEEYLDSIQPISPLAQRSKDLDFLEMYLFYGATVNTGQKELKSGVPGFNLGFGLFHKEKLTEGVSLLFDLKLDYFENAFKFPESDSLPVELKSQCIGWTMVDGAFGPRFEIPGPGKTYFLDIKAFGAYVLDRRIAEKYEVPTGEVILSEITRFGLNQRWMYGVSLSFGRGRHWLNLSYRLSDLTGSTTRGVIANYQRISATPLMFTYNLGLTY